VFSYYYIHGIDSPFCFNRTEKKYEKSEKPGFWNGLIWRPIPNGQLVFLTFFGYSQYMPEFRGSGTKFATRQVERLREPEEFRVILLNDDYTTMDFVVEILVLVFHKSGEDANRIMLDVHRKGRGIVATYPWDIAQTKADQVHFLARERQFPLRCVVEPV
jgi:ATP-dependent Clp protease adaptor protein ClpS